MTKRRAAFLDRDGVINRDSGYVYRLEDLVLLEGVPEALRLLAAGEYLLVIVTNQSGIGRGYFTDEQFCAFTGELSRLLAAQGVALAHVAYCPHLPAHLQMDDPCTCRKPLPGMLFDAAEGLNIDLSRSVMIGDNASDMAAGRAAGVSRCFLIGDPSLPADADAVFLDLLACARHVVGNLGRIDIQDSQAT